MYDWVLGRIVQVPTAQFADGTQSSRNAVFFLDSHGSKLFGSEDGYEALLQLIPDRSVVDNLRKKWEADPDRHSTDKWGDLKSEVKRFDKGSSTRVSLFRSLIISAPV